MTKFFDPKKFLEESKAKRQMPDTAATIFENPFPSSIFRTNNISEMKEACKSLLGESEMFTDPDFKPTTDSIYNSFDKVPTLPKIEWRRPNEISLKRELVGFYETDIATSKLSNM